jgi:DNA polymerase III epsilon subunit-like protein
MLLFLDTETTGLSPTAGDAVVEIAIVDSFGRAVLNTLVDPGRPIPWQATNVHGITNDMVRGQPTMAQLMPQVRQIISNQVVVIYNSSFDTPFFPGRLKEALSIECAMRRFTTETGGGRWKKLDVAAQKVGHRWTGNAHRALADALACRSVWDWLERSSRSDSTKSNDFSQSPSTGKTTTLRCTNCSRLLRVPIGKLLDITCPTCRRTFRQQT